MANRNKYCTRCKNVKHKKYFGKNKATKDGLAGWCKTCKSLAALQARHAKTKGYQYGLRKDDYEKLWHKQNGRCAICDRHDHELKTGLVIDHDHHTKRVRGLLCYKCNMLLGDAWDSPIILKKAIDFLERYNTGEIELIEVEVAKSRCILMKQ